MELALCDCGSWLSSLCKAVFSTYDARASNPYGRQLGREDYKQTGTYTLQLEPHGEGLKPVSIIVASDLGNEGIQQKWGSLTKS